MLIFRKIGSKTVEKVYDSGGIKDFVSAAREVYYESYTSNDFLNKAQSLYALVASMFTNTYAGTFIGLTSWLTGNELSTIQDNSSYMYIKALEMENLIYKSGYEACKADITFNKIEIFETDYEEVVQTYWEPDDRCLVITGVQKNGNWIEVD